MSQVHKHPHSVLEHCVWFLQLFCLCGCRIKFVLLMWQAGTKITRFSIKMSHKMTYLKGLQRTALDEPGALASTQSTGTLFLPPTTFLFLWLWNEIHFAFMAVTKITRFLIKMNHKMSHLKGLQRTTPDESGALTSTQCTRTLYVPPTTSLFLWLRNYIHFTFMSYDRHTTRFLIRMNHKISHLKGLQKTTPDELGAQTSIQCTRLLCVSPTTFLFLWLRNYIHFTFMAGTQIIITRFLIKMNHKISHNEPQKISYKSVPSDNTRWIRSTII